MEDNGRARLELSISGLGTVLSEALCIVYPRVTADHDPERGHDGNTFGTLIWRELEFEVSRLARQRGLQIEKPAGSFCVRLPSRRRVFLRKFGPGEVFDVHRLRWDGELRASMASNNAATMGQMELEFAGLSDVPSRKQAPLDLVLAHTGYPELGGFEAYLGAPQLKSDAGPWIWLDTFLRAEGDGTVGPMPTAPRPTEPPVRFSDVEIDEPMLEDVEPEQEAAPRATDGD